MPQVSPSCPQVIQSANNNPTAINKQVNILTSHLHLIEKVPNSSEGIYHIEQDYIDLFSYAKKGHMAKYVHMSRPYIYDNLLKQDTYYPFKMECNILEQKMNQIIKNFQGVTQIVEVGPGSYTPIMAKTVPLLKALERRFTFSSYKALDFNIEYAELACAAVKKRFKNIKTKSIESDFLSADGFDKVKGQLSNIGRNLMLCFGQSILANNDEKDISIFFNNIGNLMKKGDILLFGVDTNHDEEILENCYNTNLIRELLLNVMHYLKSRLDLSNFNSKAFDLVYRWNSIESVVELYLKPLKQQNFKIRDMDFFIKENQEFNIINSRKFKLPHIKNYISQFGLVVKKIISLNIQKKNTFSIIIAQKTERDLKNNFCHPYGLGKFKCQI